jgi:hydrogenase maturation protein HypF
LPGTKIKFIKIEKLKSYRIRVKGLVQGVGFRPFIYRIANMYNLTGWVENRNDGVQIKVEGKQVGLEQFLASLENEAPLVSNITSLKVEEEKPENSSTFEIIKSSDISEEITEISPDIAVCENCLRDMKNQQHRINYPFINCTNCGPRFTIIKDLPYDREKTTMAVFPMCDQCKVEYSDILDRRFHAQPVACNYCGPYYELIYHGKRIKGIDRITTLVSEKILRGEIVTIKGLGGFFMACDAGNPQAVDRLREAKNRDGKPFAVMFSCIKEVKEYAEVNSIEERELLSWRKPIVILKTRKPLADGVSVGFHTIGAMLPYMPFHYLLFEKLKLPAIVLTSGNLSEEPIIINNNTAEKKLLPVSDALLTYNRDIYNRTDDSVQMVVNNKSRLIRRSRGYVPIPVDLKLNVDGILATGAELVNCFCLGKGTQAFMSQHIGDLKNLETYEFFTQSITQFEKLFRVKPKILVCDLHPEYLSTKYAMSTSEDLVSVQHHHAHIASCMAEHGLDEKVIGVSFDGIGLGDDGKIWGGEFLVCDLADYERVTHFEYVPMPGGDKATEEPWRMGVSYLYKVFGKDILKLDLPFLNKIGKQHIELMLQMINKGINCPLTSSAGRLFDAVASILNICSYADFHAEAPMRLESIIEKNMNDEYSYNIDKVISLARTIRGIVEDIKSGVPNSVIAAKFHSTIISVIFNAVRRIALGKKINMVVLSGGTFQNRYLLEEVENLLKKNDFQVFSQVKVPCNDGGLALGQLVIAAKRREMKCV